MEKRIPTSGYYSCAYILEKQDICVKSHVLFSVCGLEGRRKEKKGREGRKAGKA